MKQAPLHVLVVDDEELARRNLTLLLDGDPEIGTVTECQSGQEAVEAITRSKPDLVFLDVQMPECGGFDVLELVGNRIPAVIFVTAYDDYALRAFEAGALDYLLKPFDDARFALALSRAKQRLAYTSQSPNPAAERLAIKSRGQVIFLVAKVHMPYENFFELLMTIDAARRSSAREVIVVVPYLPHSRQERREGVRTAISARMVADMIQLMGADGDAEVVSAN